MNKDLKALNALIEKENNSNLRMSKINNDETVKNNKGDTDTPAISAIFENITSSD